MVSLKRRLKPQVFLNSYIKRAGFKAFDDTCLALYNQLLKTLENKRHSIKYLTTQTSKDISL